MDSARLVEVDDGVDLAEHCYAMGWTDGLSVVPPTPAKVDAAIAASGRPGDEVIADYVERISHYAKVSEVELTDDDTVEARMRKAIPERARVVAMEVEGTRMTSPALARFVGQCESGAVPAIVILIGGSYGLPKAISAEASLMPVDVTAPVARSRTKISLMRSPLKSTAKATFALSGLTSQPRRKYCS